jgi:hypothetical protein
VDGFKREEEGREKSGWKKSLRIAWHCWKPDEETPCLLISIASPEKEYRV